MDNKINGITQEEIKLDLLADYGCCSECEYGKSTHDKPYGCAERALKGQVAENALALIQQLERERDEAWEIVDGLNAKFEGMVDVLESAKRKYIEACKERDAAIKDIAHVCKKCIHKEHRFLADGQLDDMCGTCIYNNMCNWQWRGVQEVE